MVFGSADVMIVLSQAPQVETYRRIDAATVQGKGIE